MPPKEKAPSQSTAKRKELAKQWEKFMQHVDRVSDSEEECVQDTQEQWPPPPPAKQPPAKKTKAHETHLGGGVRKTHYV